MVHLRNLLGIRSIDRMPNARVKRLCDVKKEVGEENEENFFSC